MPGENKTGKRRVLDAAVVGKRKELAEKIAARALLLGENPTDVPRLVLYRRTAPTSCALAMYEPSLSIFVQGRKRIQLRGLEYFCDASSFLLSSIDVPAEGQIVEASEKAPMLSMFLRLDMPMVREVLSREDLPEGPRAARSRGLAVGETTAGLLDACSRLIDLLDTREDIPFLSDLIQREIVYRVLRTPQGESLRAIATTAGELRKAAAYGRTRGRGADGGIDAASSVSRADFNEPAAIPEAVAAADGAAADADGGDGRDEHGV
jgi:AraC-type transcriptional regulator N-terminus